MSDSAYSRVARWYDLMFERVLGDLRSIGQGMVPLREGMGILDVGCGTGAHLADYRGRGCELFGVDPSPAMLEVARDRLGDAAHLSLGDASRMPYPDSSFDLVTISMVLHELDPAVRTSVMSEIRRCLKSDGHLLAIDYHAGPARSARGRFYRVVIFIVERLAGRRHYLGFRDFIGTGGMPHLAEQHQMGIVKEKVVGGGNFGVYLLRLANGSAPQE